MNKVYIVAACRTPVGRFLGALKTVSAVELAALTVRHNLQQAGIDPAWIDAENIESEDYANYIYN